MPNRFELWIEGKPHPKERPRLKRGRRAVAYTPQKSVDAEDAIAEAYQDAGGVAWDGPVKVIAEFYPEGQYVVIERAEHGSSLRGDIDNYVKTLLDGLQKGGAFNDTRVVEVWAAKHPAD